MEKSGKWFLKRETKKPNQMVYVSTKGETCWDVPVDCLPTVEEKQHWDRHPKFVSLQRVCSNEGGVVSRRSCDWAWILPTQRLLEYSRTSMSS